MSKQLIKGQRASKDKKKMQFIKAFSYLEAQETKHKPINYSQPSAESGKSEELSINLSKPLFHNKRQEISHDALNLTQKNLYKELAKASLEIKDLGVCSGKAYYAKTKEKKEKQ